MRTFDPQRLHEALRVIPPSAWSQPSRLADTNVHDGYRRVTGADLEPFRFVLDVFNPIKVAWLSWIEPGGFIRPHRDGGPYYERWQVPIMAAGTLNGEPAVDGVPFRVRHWERHSVSNPTDRPRIHLVIDRDVVVDPVCAPFLLYDEEA